MFCGGRRNNFLGSSILNLTPSDMDIIKILQLLQWISAGGSHLHSPGSGNAAHAPSSGVLK